MRDWASGLCVGLVTSLGLFGDRLALGSARTAVTADVATTLVAVLVVTRVSERRRPYVSAALGACAGIVAAHLALGPDRTPWMSERAPQFVNDVVAALATLALVFAFARRRLVLACVVATTAFVGVYAATHACWHLDRGRFEATVQECVVAQFFSVLLALWVHRAARRRLVAP